MRWMHAGSTQPTDSADAQLNRTGILHLESSIGYEVVRALRDRGHTVRIGEQFFGRYQGIMRDHERGIYFGASESRVDGQAAGY
jgi:gamma-glutamyltranspeptidase / glutathione hydrolase